MTEAGMTRTPEVIAVEINAIKAQARDVYVRSAIEIGRRLYEAKAIVPYGKWGEWLEKNVDYSVRTAQNLIAVYEEYGRSGNAQAIAGLNFTQAVLLLGLDGETRAELLESGNVQEMSTRELKAEIERLNREIEQRQVTMDQLLAGDAQALDEERRANERLREELEASKVDADAQRALDEAARANDSLRRELEAAKADAGAARQQAADAVERANGSMAEISRLKNELEAERSKPEPEPVVQRVEVLPAETEAELQRLRDQLKSAPSKAVILLRSAYEALVAQFERVESMVHALDREQPEEAARYRRAILRAIDQMQERMETE